MRASTNNFNRINKKNRRSSDSKIENKTLVWITTAVSIGKKNSMDERLLVILIKDGI
jgi:hypothetical protein